MKKASSPFQGSDPLPFSKKLALFAEAFIWTTYFRAMIHFRPFDSIVRSFPKINLAAIAQTDPVSPSSSAVSHAVASQQLFWALSSVERHIPLLPNCFSLSTAGMKMALRRGLPSEIYLGIRTTPQGLKAHAWLKTEWLILTGAKNHRTFTVTAIIRPGELITQLPTQETQPNGTVQFLEEPKS
jgi:hypothetical protein